MASRTVSLQGVNLAYQYAQPVTNIDRKTAWNLWDSGEYRSQLKLDGNRVFIYNGLCFNKSGERINTRLRVPSELTTSKLILECEWISCGPFRPSKYYVYAIGGLPIGYSPAWSFHTLNFLPLPTKQFVKCPIAAEMDMKDPTGHPLSEGIVFRHKSDPWKIYKYKPQWRK